jgi:lipopolysaccharide export system permease protein
VAGAQAMNLLARYIYSQVLIAVGFVLLALLVLFAFFDVIQELGQLGRNNYGLGQMSLFIALSVPGHIYETLPIAALIGTLFTLTRLVANSEYAIMRVSGLSNWRIATYFVVLGLLFSVLMLALGEFVSPWSEQTAQRLKLSATHAVVAQQFKSGMWVRDGQAFINAREVLPDSSLRELNIYRFGSDHRLIEIKTAQSAVWKRAQVWQLNGVVTTQFDANGVHLVRTPSETWNSVLSPDILAVLLIAPEKMSARTLYRYIDHLNQNAQQSSRYEIALWSKFMNPLAIPVMMLLAMPFALHGPRSRAANSKLFIGILAGLGFHLFARLFGHLGLLNDWPAVSVSGLPLLVFMLAAIVAIHQADRR